MVSDFSREQSRKSSYCVGARILDQADDVAELGPGSVADVLIDPALGGGHSSTGSAQAVQGDRHLLGVARRHAIGQHVDAVLGCQQVQRRLGDADVRFDADDDHGSGRGDLVQGRPHFGHIHAEAGFVGVDDDLGPLETGSGSRASIIVDIHGVKGQEAGQLGDGVAEPDTILGSDKDGDIEDLGGTDDFAGCGNAERKEGVGVEGQRRG